MSLLSFLRCLYPQSWKRWSLPSPSSMVDTKHRLHPQAYNGSNPLSFNQPIDLWPLLTPKGQSKGPMLLSISPFRDDLLSAVCSSLPNCIAYWVPIPQLKRPPDLAPVVSQTLRPNQRFTGEAFPVARKSFCLLLFCLAGCC